MFASVRASVYVCVCAGMGVLTGSSPGKGVSCWDWISAQILSICSCCASLSGPCSPKQASKRAGRDSRVGGWAACKAVERGSAAEQASGPAAVGVHSRVHTWVWSAPARLNEIGEEQKKVQRQKGGNTAAEQETHIKDAKSYVL